jgi:hypothetical protein
LAIRLCNVHAALGYGLRDVPGIELPKEAPEGFSTFWLYTIQVHAA